MKRKIRINFTDFYPGFQKTNNGIFHKLSMRFELIIDEGNPDYLIYSCFGFDFLLYDCIRIFYTGENIIPDFNLCDYATGYAYLNFEDRYIRYPDFNFNDGLRISIHRRKNKTVTLKNKERFCNFIYSNGNVAPERDNFYHLLSIYKTIDSAGKHLNNTSLPVKGKGWSLDKIDFMWNYKFSICFENSSLPGYTSEKILHAFIADTIPIYWGNPLVALDYNSNAFINCHDFKSFNEVIEKIIEVDQNDELYMQMINEHIFNEKEPDYVDDNFLLDFFSNIFDQSITTASRRAKYGYNLIYATRSRKLLNDAESYRNSFRGFKGMLRTFLNKMTFQNNLGTH